MVTPLGVTMMTLVNPIMPFLSYRSLPSQIRLGPDTITYFHTNYRCYLSLSKWWFVFCLFTPYLLVFFVSQEKLSLIESNQEIYQVSNF